MEYLSSYYGLTGEVDSKSENGQLFLTEYILLLNGKIQNESFIMNEQLQNSYVMDGLYNRNPDLISRENSHDNLSGIFSYSYLAKSEHRFKIWSYLLKHLGTYDNTKGKSAELSRFLPFNPSNFFIWGLCAESSIYLLFFPLYLISLVIACNKPLNDTSGKILSWVELLPHKDHWLVKHLYNYFEKKMKSLYGDNYLKELMKIYHGGNSHEFPINKILGN